MAGSVTSNRIATTILFPYKLVPNLLVSWKCTGRHTPAPASCGFSWRPIATKPARLLVGKVQRSVVSTHPEKRDPTNCVRGENPRIAILALNRLWILRFRPSSRCIHASLLNMQNLTCAQATDLPTSPHLGGYALNCTPERAETDKNLPDPPERQAPAMAVSAGISPRNIPFQLVYGLRLAGDDPPDKVAQRHHPHYHVVLDDGKMTKPEVRHDGHAIIHRVLTSNEDHGAGHDLPHQRLLRGVPLENNFAGIVALRQDADQLALGYNQQCADALRRHLLNGLVDRLI